MGENASFNPGRNLIVFKALLGIVVIDKLVQDRRVCTQAMQLVYTSLVVLEGEIVLLSVIYTIL